MDKDMKMDKVIAKLEKIYEFLMGLEEGVCMISPEASTIRLRYSMSDLDDCVKALKKLQEDEEANDTKSNEG